MRAKLSKLGIDYTKTFKSGYMDIKNAKWEHRFFLLTAGHLVWFENYEARKKEAPRGVVCLDEITHIEMIPL